MEETGRTRQALSEEVRRVIADQLGETIHFVTEDAHLEKDLSADSLEVVEVVMAIEEEFSIEIPDDDAVACKTVGDYVALVEKLEPTSRAR